MTFDEALTNALQTTEPHDKLWALIAIALAIENVAAAIDAKGES